MKVVVFGGGISGLLATLQLEKNDLVSEILLLESSPTLGGLLKSEDFSGLKVDFGTHLLASTGQVEIDNLLGLHASDIMCETLISSGHAINGALNRTNFLETASISPQKDGLIAFQLGEKSAEYHSSEFSHGEKFGELVNEKLFIPAISRFANIGADKVSALDDTVFVATGLKRLRLSDLKLNATLKQKSDYCDKLLAEHSGENASKIFYPRQGGMGAFIANIEKSLVESGKVTLRTGCRAEDFKSVEDKLVSFTVSGEDGEVPLDMAFWSVPAPMFGQIIDDKCMVKPSFNELCIVHIRGKGKVLSDLSYFYQHDGFGWRYTLYNNFRTDLPSDEILIGVEILGSVALNEALDNQNLPSIIRQELVDLGVVDRSFYVNNHIIRRLPNAFPVINRSDSKQTIDYIQNLENRFRNLHFIGRQAGGAFFMRDVLADTYNRVKQLFCRG